MHNKTLDRLQHNHDFTVYNAKGERRTRVVLALTFLTMALEVITGKLFGSMALLADGWHMGTHVAAFMITLYAYRYSRVHAHDQTFAFSTGKVGTLGGFASSVALAVVAFVMLLESGERLLTPLTIRFDEALQVAGFGLAINFICALLLKDSHEHSHGKGHNHSHNHADGHRHGHDHDQHGNHHDHNLKAAYFHVLADALTSVLAIAALYCGKFYGLHWLDPAMGVLGALIIFRWADLLIRETGPILLDESIALSHKAAITRLIESDADNRVADLHIWRVSPSHYAAVLSVVSHDPKTPDHYKGLLQNFQAHSENGEAGLQLAHITVEVHRCEGGDFCP